MQNNLQITLQDMPHSAALDARIHAKVAKLKKNFSRLSGCRVVVSEPHRHRQRHRPFAVSINISFPGGRVAVTRDDNEDVYALLRDAFAAAERELEKSVGRRNGRAAPHHDLHPERSPTMQESGHE